MLDLQASNGQWRLGRRLYHALGHSNSTIPTAPEGVKDGRWATALAVIFLRRRPDVIDCTFEAYRRAVGLKNKLPKNIVSQLSAVFVRR